ncbi:putative toxin-antitoxin system toxin component, PIN family [Nitrosopumilus sp.]|uniref:putative toxin-antitoxin system toxin component, PIN family n=1 Tax=Nitrosopumilus sp. TaxID=2024843 RepID=UPI0034A08BC6
MYRIVLDTNVLISAMFHNGKPRQLLKKAIDDEKYVLVTSRDIINEVSGVIRRPKFKMTNDEINDVLIALASSSDIKMITSKFKVSDDPDDDMIINTAYDGNANYIVSGDDDLLRIKEFKNIKIVTVAQMLKIL